MGWTVQTVQASGGTTVNEMDGDASTFTVPVCYRLVVSARFGVVDGVESVSQRQWSWRAEGGVITLADVPKGTSVALYDLSGIVRWQATATGATLQTMQPTGHPYLLRVADQVVKIVL